MISATSVILALVVTSPVLADLGKPALFPNGLHGPLIGLDNLPVPTFTTTQVDVPDICTSHASDAQCDTNIEAYQIAYNDCSEPWTLCRCSDAQMEYAALAYLYCKRERTGQTTRDKETT